LRSEENAEALTRKEVTKRRINEKRITRLNNSEMKKDDEILSKFYDKRN
jgi:hypothetical protein